MTPTTNKRRLAVRGMAIAAVAALTLAACSEGGAGETTDPEENGGGAPDSGVTIGMVTHEAPGDAFWDKIRIGAETAASDLGVTLRYSNDHEASRMATLIENNVDSQVDGLAVTLAFPGPVSGAVERAIDAGIPTVAFNSGIEHYADMGVLMYFGSDETVAGEAIGERLSEDGGEKALCLIQEEGAVQLEARCAGLANTFAGSSEILYAEGTDLPGLQAALTAKLQQDPEIDYVVTLGSPFAMAALDAMEQADTEARLATFDLSAEVAAAIQEGEIMFSVDQQPYVQGYLAVLSLFLNVTNGNDIGGGQPTLTGPSFVDETNVDAIVEYAANNTR